MAGLLAIDGGKPIRSVTANSHHLLILRYQPSAFGGRTRSEFVRTMMSEGITPLSNGYTPLHLSPVIRRSLGETALPQGVLPIAEQAGRESFWINQSAFLGTHADMESIVAAAKKIQQAWA